MEALRSLKWERKEEVDSNEGEDDDDSEFSERVWWRLERRSSIDECFFCNASSVTFVRVWSSIVFANWGVRVRVEGVFVWRLSFEQ